ncbi:efflux RND transporter permease subunit [Adlercreutzia aquisgranensis]|uniref:efflux RND transporter permease subunit n=1 Tax=Adlercreutzia aquisgranensis TaxID=2941323 RepID=UPI002040D18F|nr:efflux RND transporter permease subunit [Adlercreutzia aquisgranensis]
MLSRFSVKYPYIVVVAVIVSLILGGVSLSQMKSDLLPEMDIPYLAVIATDPGASAEKVQSELTEPLEGALSTVNGVANVTSQSANNYAVVFLEFEDGTNMDSAMVKVSSAINEVQASLPETAGAPNIVEISMDMMATSYVAAICDGKNIYELSDMAENDLVPRLERIDGVADVSVTGLVQQTVEVRLSDSKIEDVNNRILASVNSELEDAKREIDEGEEKLAEAEAEIKAQQEELEGAQQETTDQLGQAVSGLTLAVSSSTSKVTALGAQLQALQTQGEALGTALEAAGQRAAEAQAKLEAATTMEEAAEAQAELAAVAEEAQTIQDQLAEVQKQAEELAPQLQQASDELTTYQGQLAEAEAGTISAASGFGSGQAQLASALTTIEANKESLTQARDQYEDAREQAIEQANVDALVDKNTLAQLIKAQDFSMPAGYLGNSDEDNQWLLHVGDNITSVEQLEGLLLLSMDEVGDIRLSDVADITVVDNAGASFMKLNGQEGVMLAVFKSSTASTNEVSSAVNRALPGIMDEFPGLRLEVVSDQGSYIDLFISSLLQSLLLGALLAVVVLALFLRDWKPTVLVAVSIPFSVLLALLVMYFAGISLNVMSLGGLSLGIGMLVDNSVVVLENIYRLRGRGISPARAAVQGAKQISGAVIASTLTTLCVFVPIAFTTGMVNQMLMPFAMTLTYVLTASLVVALTLVPALSRFVFRSHKERKEGLFGKVKDAYGRSLQFCLRHKVLPVLVAVGLVVVSVAGVLNMGISMIPTMSSKTVEASMTLPEDTPKEEAFALADQVMGIAQSIEGVESVSGIDGTATLSMVSSAASDTGEEVFDMFAFYISVDDSVTTDAQVMAIMDQLVEQTSDLPCEIATMASSNSSMESLAGGGLSLTITGDDRDELLRLSEQVMEAVGRVEGYTEIGNGMEDAEAELSLVIDEDALTREGWTVAQLYQNLADALSHEAASATIWMDGAQAGVTIVDETQVLTRENILDYQVSITDGQGEAHEVALGEFATLEEGVAASTIVRENSRNTITVTAEVEDGYNNALLSRELEKQLDALDIPDGYLLSFGGELENINTMMEQMMLLLVAGFALIYLVMVAQFQSLLSPFIVILTIPLAFTGGFLALWAAGEQLTMMSLMGFAVLMGTVVNNGIVLVDYVNQLRRGGLEKRDALEAAGRTRMRPILMTALTTILAMVPLAFGQDIGASMQRGMALVVMGGLVYATFMTLYIVPIFYDLLYRRTPTEVDLGDESIDDDPGDAQAYLEQLRERQAAVASA